MWLFISSWDYIDIWWNSCNECKVLKIYKSCYFYNIFLIKLIDLYVGVCSWILQYIVNPTGKIIPHSHLFYNFYLYSYLFIYVLIYFYFFFFFQFLCIFSSSIEFSLFLSLSNLFSLQLLNQIIIKLFVSFQYSPLLSYCNFSFVIMMIKPTTTQSSTSGHNLDVWKHLNLQLLNHLFFRYLVEEAPLWIQMLLPTLENCISCFGEINNARKVDYLIDLINQLVHSLLNSVCVDSVE